MSDIDSFKIDLVLNFIKCFPFMFSSQQNAATFSSRNGLSLLLSSIVFLWHFYQPCCSSAHLIWFAKGQEAVGLGDLIQEWTHDPVPSRLNTGQYFNVKTPTCVQKCGEWELSGHRD